jgi:hypothetical protein
MLEVTLKAPAEPQVRKVWGAGGPAAMGGGVVFYNGFVYTADPLDGGRMSAHVYDGTNGRHIFSTGTLPYKYKKTVFDYPSPVTSARHAFVFNDRYCAVLEQAPNPKLVAINTYERMFAGVFLDGDRIYMRTYDSIICIGPKGQEGADYANEAPRRIELAELAMVAAGNKFNRRDQAVAYINKHHANEPAALVMALDFIEKENQFTNALALLPECITDANRGGFVSAVKAQLAERPPAEKERLYRLLPPAGGDAALAILTGALAGDAPETRLAAARTLGRWPDEKPLAGLQAVVESQAAKDLRTTALRAMLGILETGGLDVQKKQAALTGLVTAATELKMLPEVFGAAARLPTPAAMAFLGRYVRDARTGNDAAAAMVACAEIAEPEHLKELVQSFGAHAKEAGSAPARKQLDAALPVLKERLSNVPPKIGDDDSIKLLDLDF